MMTSSLLATVKITFYVFTVQIIFKRLLRTTDAPALPWSPPLLTRDIQARFNRHNKVMNGWIPEFVLKFTFEPCEINKGAVTTFFLEPGFSHRYWGLLKLDLWSGSHDLFA